MRTKSLIVIACLAFGCNNPKGRVKSGDEGDLVGSKTAGAETYNALIEEATRKLLNAEAARFPDGSVRKICFVGIENKSAEELGDIRDSTNEIIETVLFQAKRYDMIGQRYVTHVLQVTGMRAEDVFLQEGLEKFVSVLRKEGQDPDYLLWAIYTSLSTTGEKERQRDYLLTLELTDARSGRLMQKETAKVRKAYR
ncbi:MAG: penicillin-binding protein activator LpoB [Planctomycetota bacterium]